jgi:DNA-binding NtrC family response regulator
MMPGAQVLIVEDDRLLGENLTEALAEETDDVHWVKTGAEALAALEKAPPDVCLLDYRLPDCHGIHLLKEIRLRGLDAAVILMTGFAEVPLAVEAMQAGAYTFLVKPLDLHEVQRHVGQALASLQVRRDLATGGWAAGGDALGALLGLSPAIRRIKELVERVAASARTAVLLTGETGTGKELIAEAIHASSARAGGPLIKVNCSAIPETLLEAELFGYERGAFTGAREGRRGLFEQADGGTIFLDEVSELRPSLQPKLLRALEDRTVRRIGGARDVPLNVRAIAATNRDLERRVREGGFREDLYFRLRVVHIAVPPLRDRPEDILPLAAHFLGRFTGEMEKEIRGFAPLTERVLTGYGWPGNVRELRNAIEQAVILAEGPLLGPDLFPDQAAGHRLQGVPGRCQLELPLGLPLQEVERRYIRFLLEELGPNRSEASRILGVSRGTLRRKLRDLNL